MGILGKRHWDFVRVQVVREYYVETPPSVRLCHVSPAFSNSKVSPLCGRWALRAIHYFPDPPIEMRVSNFKAVAGFFKVRSNQYKPNNASISPCCCIKTSFFASL